MNTTETTDRHDRRVQLDAAGTLHALLRDHQDLPLAFEWRIRRGDEAEYLEAFLLPADSADVRADVDRWAHFLGSHVEQTPAVRLNKTVVSTTGTYRGVTVHVRTMITTGEAR